MMGLRKRSDQDFAQEIEAHLELETDRLREEGLSEQEARNRARRAFGNVTRALERFHESVRLMWLERLAQDLRYAVRLLRKSPGFSAVTILTLAIGIGANTAMFSVVDGYLLRPVPYPDSDRLITVWTHPPEGGHLGVSPANFLDIREQSRSFEHMGVLAQSDFSVSTGSGAELLSGFRVTAQFLDTLGVKPAMGRGFLPDEDRSGAASVAILSHDAWQNKFGSDPHILNRVVTVDGAKSTIIGVMPPGFRFAYAPELWTQLVIDPDTAARDIPNLLIFAKLRSDRSLKQASAEMQGILGNLAQAYPQAGLKGWSADLVPWQQELTGYHRDAVLALFGAVGCMLLIACVNVANLMLARSAVRQRELAVRAALGAGRARLMRQLLTESMLLSALAAIAGVLLARALVPLVSTLISEPFRDGIAPIGIDARVLAFTLALSLLTAVLFGLAPAWRASQVNLSNALKDTGRAFSGGSSGKRFRGALVVVEVALSLALLVGAGLMVRSMAAYSSVDPGLRVENVLTLRVVMPEERYRQAERVRAFDHELLEKARAMPGVRAACLASHMPLESSAFSIRFQIGGRDKKAAPFLTVTDGYFETLGIRLLKGRFFNDRDTESAPRVAIVNETFVKRHLAHEEPLGQRLAMEQWRVGKAPPGPSVAPVNWEIVGVIADASLGGLGSQAMAQIYAPVWQQPRAGGVLAVRADSDPSALAPVLRKVVRSVDADVPVTGIRTMEEIAQTSVALASNRTWMIVSFASISLILAALGIYGVLSYSVSQSTQEMGIRMALGARPSQVLFRTLRGGICMAGLGLIVGLAGSFGLTRLLRSLLYGVKPTDPVTYFVVSALLMAVALAAAYLPARRAARVDPAVAVRWE